MLCWEGGGDRSLFLSNASATKSKRKTYVRGRNDALLRGAAFSFSKQRERYKVKSVNVREHLQRQVKERSSCPHAREVAAYSSLRSLRPAFAMPANAARRLLYQRAEELVGRRVGALTCRWRRSDIFFPEAARSFDALYFTLVLNIIVPAG